MEKELKQKKALIYTGNKIFCRHEYIEIPREHLTTDEIFMFAKKKIICKKCNRCYLII